MQPGWAIIFSNAPPLCPMLLRSSPPTPPLVIYSPFLCRPLSLSAVFLKLGAVSLRGFPVALTSGACIPLDRRIWVWGRSLEHSNGGPRYLKPPLGPTVPISHINHLGDLLPTPRRQPVGLTTPSLLVLSLTEPGR